MSRIPFLQIQGFSPGHNWMLQSSMSVSEGSNHPQPCQSPVKVTPTNLGKGTSCGSRFQLQQVWLSLAVTLVTVALYMPVVCEPFDPGGPMGAQLDFKTD